MFGALVFIMRLVTGVAVLVASWFVFDRIHDRNTEIVVSILGLTYCFIFLVSRRLEYFGLSVFSFFGRTVSHIQKIPYDQVMRDEIGLPSSGRHLYLNVVFTALVELLCVYRLVSSLSSRGWDAVSDPINKLIASAF
ncbi:hypothetical protein DFR50_10325 [Roseiarcus fermentans]|uniref:Uncharacterized protein n=2 Tax=Roseiarcus fermentans TaxID=1473586 RepID=A0A366FSW5_9HYPH|nr:hypothetical protein DFR50_10325 [Roseiarcus fermentans]